MAAPPQGVRALLDARTLKSYGGVSCADAPFLYLAGEVLLVYDIDNCERLLTLAGSVLVREGFFEQVVPYQCRKERLVMRKLLTLLVLALALLANVAIG